VPDDTSIFTQIPGYLVNNNVKLRVTINPEQSFILDELSSETLHEYMLDGSFYNRQRVGLTVKNFLNENLLSTRYQVVATINSQPEARPSSVNVTEAPQDEYIAILESLDIPLYFILYDISYS
jgi:hypothetical protein